MVAPVRRTSRWVASVVIALVVAGSPAGGQAEQRESTISVQRFTAAIAAYVALHRQIERDVPPQKIFTDPGEAERSMQAMANAMRGVRSHAREGDIFTEDVASLFRRQIHDALRDSGLDLQAVIDETIAESPEEVEPPTVNGSFSWALGNTMPPCVLRALPQLPIELQYRFVGTDLVLIDLHANLVVDILRDALPGHSRVGTSTCCATLCREEPMRSQALLVRHRIRGGLGDLSLTMWMRHRVVSRKR